MSRVSLKAEASAPLTDASTMRADLYALCARLCAERHITGSELMGMLKDVSEEVYTAGIDRTFARAKLIDMDNVADSFDNTWLTVLAVKLTNFKHSTRRTR